MVRESCVASLAASELKLSSDDEKMGPHDSSSSCGVIASDLTSEHTVSMDWIGAKLRDDGVVGRMCGCGWWVRVGGCGWGWGDRRL
jgi:hypothetical protein